MAAEIDIRVNKANKIYTEGEIITGNVLINTQAEIKHEGISISMEGLVSLQLSPKNIGIFEAFYNSVKPVQLCQALQGRPPGKILPGRTSIPFEIPLVPKSNRTLYETYHGVFINVQYTIKCELKRGFLLKDVVKVAEFLVEYKPDKTEKALIKELHFTMTPGKNENDLGTLPKFKITGSIDSTVCCINKPFSGQIVINQTEIPIKSIELQLVRVETCGCAEGHAKDVTEIQNIQIGVGSVATNIEIPIYMIFPRLFSCPTLITTNFKIEFEVNVVVVFENDHTVFESFPIFLTRV